MAEKITAKRTASKPSRIRQVSPPRGTPHQPTARATLTMRQPSRCALGGEGRVNDRTIAGESSRLDDLVVPLHRQGFRLLVHQDFQERIEILRIEAGCGSRDPPCHIEVTDDF